MQQTETRSRNQLALCDDVDVAAGVVLPHVAIASWRQPDRLLTVIDLQFLLRQLFGCKEICQNTNVLQ